MNLKNNTLKSLIIEVNLPKFKNLDVSFNKLEYLEIKNPNQNIKYLYFNNNKLKSITENTLSGLSNVIEIDLQYNCIELLERNSFKNLRMLKRLNLASNKIKRFDKETFSNMIDLEYLNLSANKFETIEKDYFKDLYKLVELDLSANKLKSIEDFALRNLFQVKKIFLNSNFNLAFTENSLYGLNRSREIIISFKTLLYMSNQNIIQTKFMPQQVERKLGNIWYHNSINFDYFEEEIDCKLTIDFLKNLLHLKLKTNSQFSKFSEKCLK